MKERTPVVGQRFNKLLVIGSRPGTGRSGVYLLCRCDCGTEKWIRKDNVIRGNVVSCGCARREKFLKYHYEVGNRFGNLEIVSVSRGILGVRCLGCQREAEVPRKVFRGSRRKFKAIHGCGCANRKHGHAAPWTAEYRTWVNMLTRARPGPGKERAKNSYGHVTVCAAWDPFQGGSFENFFAVMGWRAPGLSLDRIDTDGGYWCGRCSDCKANGRRLNCRWATRSEQATNRRPYWMHWPDGTMRLWGKNKATDRSGIAIAINP